MRSDLHVHTSCSDGLKSPEEVVRIAVGKGLDYLAISDHDTLEGYRRARSFLDENPALQEKITLIPGMEISCASDDGRDVHMLAYFIEELSCELEDELADAGHRRFERTLSIADKLHEAGYPIDREQISHSGKTVNRVTVARALIDAGCVESVSEAFSSLIGKGCPYYVDRYDIPATKAIGLILRSGGVPVLAHPALYHVVDCIEPYRELGLMGVEAYHSEHTPEQAEMLAQMADRLGLLVTGGSDSHEDAIHPASIGDTHLPDHYLESFLAADPRIS